MKIPFTKAHGAKNDSSAGREAAARAVCDLHTGLGADG
jgi:hypothetical protein